MLNRISHEQLVAHDDEGEPHVVMVTRTAIPGSPHLHGVPHYTWNQGQVLHLVDTKVGVLECAATGRRLQVDAWRG